MEIEGSIVVRLTVSEVRSAVQNYVRSKLEVASGYDVVSHCATVTVTGANAVSVLIAHSNESVK